MAIPPCFALLATGQLLLALLLPIATAHGPSAAGGLAALIAAGLCLDNAVLAAGGHLRDRGRLLAFSRARYLLHALVTPLLLPLAVLTARSGGLPAPAWLLPLAWGGSAAWILAAWWVGYRHLDLRLQERGQLVRHHNASRHGQPWLRLLLLAVVVVILVLGSRVPAGGGGGAMVAGGLAMLAGAVLAPRLGLAVANLGELLLMGSLAAALLA